MESSAVVLQPAVQTAATATTKEAKLAKPRWLLSPTADLLMIGGGSLLVFALAYLFVDKNANTNQVSWTAFYLAFLVNNPHFAASYLLLYRDKRAELFSNKRIFWAAIVAPLLIAGYMAAGIAVESPRLLSYAVNVMYFTVGWHYIKQIYGTIVVTSARRGYYFNKHETWLIKANLFPIWFMSFINGNLGVREVMHYGIGYHTFGLPAWTQYVNYALLGVSLAVVFGVIARKWLNEGKLPGWSAAASFLAIYVWYLPQLYHSVFWFVIPMFHSLQYMLFVTTLKKNQYTAEAERIGGNDGVARRKAFAKSFFGFAAAILILGYLAFDGVPFALDQVVPYDHKIFGPQLFMFLFITFINIHHYFIDNVIWRRDNPALKAYL